MLKQGNAYKKNKYEMQKGTMFEELDKPYLESQGDSCWQAEMNY